MTQLLQNVFRLLPAILQLLGTGILHAQNLDDLIDGGESSKKEASILDDLIEGRSQGYPVRLVRFDSPEDAIGYIWVRAEAVLLEPLQMSLFDTGERKGNTGLGVTLAQLKALCGDDKVGTPLLRDSYGEDGFELGHFEGRSRRVSSGGYRGLRMCLSRYRPPRPLRVRLLKQRPALVLGEGFGGRVIGCSGPFRVNTEWWRSRREELDGGSIRDIYDVQLLGGVTYRVAYCYPQQTWWALGWYD